MIHTRGAHLDQVCPTGISKETNMAKIRDDLEGVVFAYTEDGFPLGAPLHAGDDVPDGVIVGDHLIAASDRGAPDDGDSAPSKPRGNSGRDTWAEYATTLGVEFDEDATREDIKAAIEAAQS